MRFLQSRKRFVALTGGLGAGKSFGLAVKSYQLQSINAGFEGLLISRSHKQLYDFLLPQVFKVLKEHRAQYRVKDGNKIIIENGKFLNADGTVNDGVSTIHLLSSMNKAYENWAGGNIAWVAIDELDEHQEPYITWQQANDRVRVKAPLLQTVSASTPNGYGFLWDFFENQPNLDPTIDDRELILAATFDNPHLDISYVRNQIRTRNPLLLESYLLGKFTNLSGTTVYPMFDKELNGCNYTIQNLPAKGLTAHIGMDFNVVNPDRHPRGIIGILAVHYQGNCYVIDELFGESRTEEMIIKMKRRWGPYFNRICVYPDASGKSNKTSAAESDRLQLVNAGFIDKSPASNPNVKDRVNSMNDLILNTAGHRRLFVNPNTAPNTVKALQMQAYGKDGTPQKDTKDGFDDLNDALGYMVHNVWPSTGDDPMPRAVPWS